MKSHRRTRTVWDVSLKIWKSQHGSKSVEQSSRLQFLALENGNLIPVIFQQHQARPPKPMDRDDSFYDLSAIVKAAQPKNRFLEDYLQVFKTHDFDDAAYRRTLEPLLAIAANNGFQYMQQP